MKLGVHLGYWAHGTTAEDQLAVAQEAERLLRQRLGSRGLRFRRGHGPRLARQIQELYLDGRRDEAMAAIPAELIDTVSLCGPADRVRERLAVYRESGVGTLGVAPMASTTQGRLEQLRLIAQLAAA